MTQSNEDDRLVDPTVADEYDAIVDMIFRKNERYTYSDSKEQSLICRNTINQTRWRQSTNTQISNEQNRERNELASSDTMIKIILQMINEKNTIKTS